MTDKTKPAIDEVLEAVRTLILWTGDNPDREGLVETPKRVAKAYKEFFSGYDDDPIEILKYHWLLLIENTLLMSRQIQLLLQIHPFQMC